MNELLLQNGNRVLGVEPNEEMCRAAKGVLLGPHPCFEPVSFGFLGACTPSPVPGRCTARKRRQHHCGACNNTDYIQFGAS